MSLSRYMMLKDTRSAILIASKGGLHKTWLDAADLTTITESGGDTSQIDDKTGNANNATQGVESAQPKSGVNNINGLNVLNFQADGMSIADNAGLRPGAAGITIFAILRVNTDTGNSINFLRKWLSPNLGYLINLNNASSPDAMTFGISDNGTSGSFFAGDQPPKGSTMIIEFKGRATSSVNSEFFIDGVIAGSSTKNVFATTNVISIGEGSNSNFDLGELHIYMGELLPLSRQNIRRDLRIKWGM